MVDINKLIEQYNSSEKFLKLKFIRNTAFISRPGWTGRVGYVPRGRVCYLLETDEGFGDSLYLLGFPSPLKNREGLADESLTFRHEGLYCRYVHTSIIHENCILLN